MLDARDPVCGMTVEVVTAYSEAVAGDTYYFCSETCRERFDADPGPYLTENRPTTPDLDSQGNGRPAR